MLPTKNVNAGKETEARLLRIPLWKPVIGECSHCFLETLMAIFEPPGTLVTFVKMSYLDHPSLSASLTSQLTFPFCVELEPAVSTALKQLPVELHPSSRRRSKHEPGMQGRLPNLKPAHPAFPPSTLSGSSHTRPLTPPHSLQLCTSAWASPSRHRQLESTCGSGKTTPKDTSLKVSSLQCPEGFQTLPPVPSTLYTLLSATVTMKCNGFQVHLLTELPPQSTRVPLNLGIPELWAESGSLHT